MASSMDFTSYFSDDNSNLDEISYDDNDDFSPSTAVDRINSKIKRSGKRGRKPAKVDVKAKLERSRQSARECRARKKLRYQYLEELVASRERSIHILRKELDQLKEWCIKIDTLDKGDIPQEVYEFVSKEKQRRMNREAKMKNFKSNNPDSGFYSGLSDVDKGQQLQNLFFMKLDPNSAKSFYPLSAHISTNQSSTVCDTNKYFDSNTESLVSNPNSKTKESSNSPTHVSKQEPRRYTLTGQNRLLAQLIEQDLETPAQNNCENSFSSHLLTEINSTGMKN